MGKITIHGDNSPAGVLRHWERKTRQECAREILRCWNEAESMRSQLDAFIKATKKAEENGYGQDSVHHDDSWIDDLGTALDRSQQLRGGA